IVHDVIDRMRERNVDQRAVRKHTLDLATEALVESIVVVDVQEAAALQVLSQARDLSIAEANVAVPGDVDERIIPKLLVHECDTRFRFIDLKRRTLANRREQVRQAGRVGIPVAAAVVLQTRDGEYRSRRTRAG